MEKELEQKGHVHTGVGACVFKHSSSPVTLLMGKWHSSPFYTSKTMRSHVWHSKERWKRKKPALHYYQAGMWLCYLSDVAKLGVAVRCDLREAQIECLPGGGGSLLLILLSPPQESCYTEPLLIPYSFTHSLNEQYPIQHLLCARQCSKCSGTGWEWNRTLPRAYILAGGKQGDHCKKMLRVQVVTIKTRVAASHLQLLTFF